VSECDLHLSLRDRDGNPAFHLSGRPGNMSDTMRWFILRTVDEELPEAKAFYGPSR
jgi:glutamine synthetase